jgi:hypothetical protein
LLSSAAIAAILFSPAAAYAALPLIRQLLMLPMPL